MKSTKPRAPKTKTPRYRAFWSPTSCETEIYLTGEAQPCIIVPVEPPRYKKESLALGRLICRALNQSSGRK